MLLLILLREAITLAVFLSSSDIRCKSRWVEVGKRRDDMVSVCLQCFRRSFAFTLGFFRFSNYLCAISRDSAPTSSLVGCFPAFPRQLGERFPPLLKKRLCQPAMTFLSPKRTVFFACTIYGFIALCCRSRCLALMVVLTGLWLSASSLKLLERNTHPMLSKSSIALWLRNTRCRAGSASKSSTRLI